jgi:hypothetical protein
MDFDPVYTKVAKYREASLELCHQTKEPHRLEIWCELTPVASCPWRPWCKKGFFCVCDLRASARLLFQHVLGWFQIRLEPQGRLKLGDGVGLSSRHFEQGHAKVVMRTH